MGLNFGFKKINIRRNQNEKIIINFNLKSLKTNQIKNYFKFYKLNKNRVVLYL